MNKFMVGSILLLIVVLGGAGAWFWQLRGLSREESSNQVMRVARYYWPGQFWVEIADAKGWFKEAGLNVELVDTNPDYYASLDDVANGTLDTQDFYLFDLVRYNLEGKNIVMVINNDESAGADGLVVGNDIKTAADLEGKRIGLTVNSNSDYLLYTFLQRHRVSVTDVTKVDMVAEKTLDAFINGEIDGFVAYEPYISEAVEKHNAHKLFDTSEMPGVSPIGYSFRKEFIDNRPQDVQAFVNVWHRTTQFIQEHPQEAFAIIARNNNVEPREVEAFLQQDKLRTLDENITAFTYSAGFESLHGTARQINNYFLREKITDTQLDSTTFIDGRFVRELR